MNEWKKQKQNKKKTKQKQKQKQKQKTVGWLQQDCKTFVWEYINKRKL